MIILRFVSLPSHDTFATTGTDYYNCFIPVCNHSKFCKNVIDAIIGLVKSAENLVTTSRSDFVTLLSLNKKKQTTLVHYCIYYYRKSNTTNELFSGKDWIIFCRLLILKHASLSFHLYVHHLVLDFN